MATEQKEITDPCAKYNEQTSFLSLGLIVVQGIYAYKFMKNLWYLLTNVNEMMQTPSCSPYSISLMW